MFAFFLFIATAIGFATMCAFITVALNNDFITSDRWCFGLLAISSGMLAVVSFLLYFVVIAEG
jgi:hypothetical protein